MRMKKFTLMLVVALMSAMGAMAQDADSTKVDTLFYSLKDGSFSEPNATYPNYYKSWTSEDSLLHISFPGYIYYKGSGNWYYILAGQKVTFTCNEDYRLVDIYSNGYANDDSIYFYHDDSYCWMQDSAAWDYIYFNASDSMSYSFYILDVAEDLYGNFGLYDDGETDPKTAYTLFSIVPATATGISNVKQAEPIQKRDDAWYDMTGRRVATPGKGVYIRNGRKYVVK